MRTRNEFFNDLVSDELTLDNVSKLSEAAYESFLDEPSGSTLILVGVFRTLAQHLDDGQGIRTETIAPFATELFPLLCRWLATDESLDDSNLIDSVAACLVKCIRRN